MNQKLQDNTQFMLELFQARKRVKTSFLVEIFETNSVVQGCIKVLKSRGLVKNVGYGVWGLVE